MDKPQIPLLAEVLELYYGQDELIEMVAIFDVTLPESTVWKMGHFSWLAAARQLVEQIDHGNHYQCWSRFSEL